MPPSSAFISFKSLSFLDISFWPAASWHNFTFLNSSQSFFILCTFTTSQPFHSNGFLWRNLFIRNRTSFDSFWLDTITLSTEILKILINDNSICSTDQSIGTFWARVFWRLVFSVSHFCFFENLKSHLTYSCTDHFRSCDFWLPGTKFVRLGGFR